jgi:hypothetical protein
MAQELVFITGTGHLHEDVVSLSSLPLPSGAPIGIGDGTDATQSSTSEHAHVHKAPVDPQRGRRSMGVIGGEAPTWIVPKTSKPCR